MTDEPKPFDPARPAWDTSKPGGLPKSLREAFEASKKIADAQQGLLEEVAALSPEQRIARLEEIQTEALLLANSPGQSLMTPEQHFIHSWQNELTVARAGLNDSTNLKYRVERRWRKIKKYTRRVATALYKLGRINEALECASPFPDLVEHITWIKNSLGVPDEDLHTHACPRPQGLIEGKQAETDRRWNEEDIFSEKHGKLAHVWVCQVCGEANATPETPERQRRYTEQSRAITHAALMKNEAPVSSALLVP